MHGMKMTQSSVPCGRFAPTPSGPLHLGSLYAALAGFLDMRQRGGEWRLRIDDLDAPRCDPAATAVIIEQLRAHGLHWDGEPRQQSAHLPDYREALERLHARELIYACRCPRKALKRSAPPGPDGPVYPGTCRERGLPFDDAALRFRVGDDRVRIDDAVLGRVQRVADSEIGDFIVRRRDGPIAYQLASVVDDIAVGTTDVLRGHDLLGSSLRQVALFGGLGHAAPAFAHVPVLVDEGGKLSKQHHAKPIDSARAADNLRWCLNALGQAEPPPALADTSAMLDWAIEHWRRDALPQCEAIRVDD